MPDKNPSYDALRQRVKALENVEERLVRTQRKLEESEKRLNSFLDNSPVGMGIWDREFRYVYINESLRKINGPSRDAHLGHTLEEVLPKAAHIIRPLFQKILETAEPLLDMRLSGEIPSHPGTLTHYLVSYFPVSVREGRPEYIGGTIVDITQQKTAEDLIRENQQKFQSMVDNIGIGVALIGPDMAILELNRQMRDWYPHVEPGDRPVCFQTLHFPPREAACNDCPTARTLADGQVHEAKVAVAGEEGEKTFRVISSPILDNRGRVKAVIKMMEDITSQLAIDKQLLHAQKMESLGSLAGGIAHDFNNLLFPIIGLSDMLMEDLPRESGEYDSAADIFNAAKRAGDLVKQILAFSRQSESQKMPVPLQKVLSEAVKLSRSTIPVNIRMTYEIQKDAPPVLADPTQVHQVAMNLITNAYHAVESMDGEIHVRLETAPAGTGLLKGMDVTPGAYTLLTVSDNGPGIPPETLKQVFEPYFTTKKKGKGTGLGLAVVHGIVKDHNGDIRIDSEPGRGTRVRVCFPLAEIPGASPTGDKEKQVQKGTERILLVDDETPVLKLEKAMLQRLGYTVEDEASSLTALEKFRRDPGAFDLVITDMTMPGMTGDRLAREIMAIKPDMPVVACTGFSEKMDPEKAAHLGIKGFLFKPVLKSELGALLRKILDKS